MRKVLPQKFFNQSALKVAQNLLGKFLVRKLHNRKISLMITEVEAYDGFKDKASHASRGKTERNKIMFGLAGRFYVYFTYGMHWMLNIVTGSKNYPAAVLIRAAGDINGPAKLTKYLKIDKKFNGSTANRKTGLWFEDRGVKIKKSQIKKSKRIGVEYAGKWANKHYRFFISK
ncbi:MAG: DNA-3-methyladenine glycosylase [Patescibacteria group bacterium]